MAIDSDDANKIRVGTLGRSVDTPLDAASLPQDWTTTGPAGNRNALDDSIGERVITRLLNNMNTAIAGAEGATNGFTNRFTNVVGDETTPEFAALGGTLIEALTETRSEVESLVVTGGGMPEPPDNEKLYGRKREQGHTAGEWEEVPEGGSGLVQVRLEAAGAAPGDNEFTADVPGFAVDTAHSGMVIRARLPQAVDANPSHPFRLNINNLGFVTVYDRTGKVFWGRVGSNMWLDLTYVLITFSGKGAPPARQHWVMQGETASTAGAPPWWKDAMPYFRYPLVDRDTGNPHEPEEGAVFFATPFTWLEVADGIFTPEDGEIYARSRTPGETNTHWVNVGGEIRRIVFNNHQMTASIERRPVDSRPDEQTLNFRGWEDPDVTVETVVVRRDGPNMAPRYKPLSEFAEWERGVAVPNTIPFFSTTNNRLWFTPFTWMAVSDVLSPPDDGRNYARMRHSGNQIGQWVALGARQVESQTGLNQYVEAGFYASVDNPSPYNMSNLPPGFGRYEPFQYGISYSTPFTLLVEAGTPPNLANDQLRIIKQTVTAVRQAYATVRDHNNAVNIDNVPVGPIPGTTWERFCFHGVWGDWIRTWPNAPYMLRSWPIADASALQHYGEEMEKIFGLTSADIAFIRLNNKGGGLKLGGGWRQTSLVFTIGDHTVNTTQNSDGSFYMNAQSQMDFRPQNPSQHEVGSGLYGISEDGYWLSAQGHWMSVYPYSGRGGTSMSSQPPTISFNSTYYQPDGIGSPGNLPGSPDLYIELWVQPYFTIAIERHLARAARAADEKPEWKTWVEDQPGTAQAATAAAPAPSAEPPRPRRPRG